MGNTFNTGRLINGLFTDASGNVGIGNTTPSYKLDVTGTGRFTGGLISQGGFTGFQYNSAGAYPSYNTYFGAIGTNFSNSGSELDIWNTVGGGFAFRRQTAASTQNVLMYIGSSGNIGIGTSSPNGTLEVYAATPTIISGASASGSLHGYEFRQNNTVDAYIKQLPSTGELRFYVGRNSSWGGNMSFWTDTVNRMSLSSNGTFSVNGPRFIQQGLSRLCYAGSVQGSQSITITLNVGSQSAVKITAAMNHYGYISGYGCARMSWVGSTPAFSEINISDVTSANGGSWSFGNGGSGIITITKNAGTYGGGGNFFVEVIGNDPISIA
jgi:hypothetical protein